VTVLVVAFVVVAVLVFALVPLATSRAEHARLVWLAVAALFVIGGAIAAYLVTHGGGLPAGA
jgi:type II secretory pathway pseudopilin PulG